jgi:hypothetical protein
MTQNRGFAFASLGLLTVLGGCTTVSEGSTTTGRGPASVGHHFFVKNNSSAELKCNHRSASETWQGWRALSPGEEWTSDGADELHYFSCSSPAEAMVYRIRPGRRYSLLRQPPGSAVIKLVEISTD